MTTAEVLDAMRQRLGQGAPYWPNDHLVLLANQAQRLMVLLQPYRLYRRTATTLVAPGSLVDLTLVVPQLLALKRVMLGNAVTPEGTRAYGQIRRLAATTLAALAARPPWLADVDVPRQYVPLGKTLLMVYPRPGADTTITLGYWSLPTTLTIDALAREPDLQAAYHPQLITLATGLALLREGAVEAQKGLQMVREILPASAIKSLADILASMAPVSTGASA